LQLYINPHTSGFPAVLP